MGTFFCLDIRDVITLVGEAFFAYRIHIQTFSISISCGRPLMMMYWDVKKTVARSGNVLPR